MQHQDTGLPCPLCGGVGTALWHQDSRRDYHRCTACLLVFVPAGFHLDAAAEKAIYDLHRNDPADMGYQRFLSRLLQPLRERLSEGARGLDVGCGPGPALARMLEQAGHPVALYDKFYYPDPAPLRQRYDFVCATEVVEHLPDPARVLPQWFDLLNPGGWLAIMTKRVRDLSAFSRWHYIQDPTHIGFYSEETFYWIAQRWHARLELIGADVALLQRPKPV